MACTWPTGTRFRAADLPPPSLRAAGGVAIVRDRDGVAACAILSLVVRLVRRVVRPDDVLTGLRLVAGFAPPVPPVATRFAQGQLDAGGRVTDPLARRGGPRSGASAPSEEAVGALAVAGGFGGGEP
jgi:hypothetical protein